MSGIDKKAQLALVAVSAIGAVAAVAFTIYKQIYIPRFSSQIRKPNGTGSGVTEGSSATEKGIRPVAGIKKRKYTRAKLAEFDGVKNEQILVSVKMKVYAVTPHFYGPDSPYHVFAGREASCCMAKSDLTGKYLDKTWAHCTEDELRELEDYKALFDSKYPVVGWYEADDDFYKVVE